MVRIYLIGAGTAGTALLSRVLRFDWVSVIGVADRNPTAPGIILAQECGIPVATKNILRKFPSDQVDILFDLSGDSEIEAYVTGLPDRQFSVVGGETDQDFLEMCRQLNDWENEPAPVSGQNQLLDRAFSILSATDRSDAIFESVVEGGMILSEMPAGSLSLYQEDKKQMFQVFGKGFTTEFYQNPLYQIREGGLCQHVMSQREPLIIPDVSQSLSFNNPVLVKQGVRSLIAVPLVSEDSSVGILYLDDFKPRLFSNAMQDDLARFSRKASAAIQIQKIHERFMSLSLKDPITGLFNHRYIREILALELDRALRLHHPLSLILLDLDRAMQMSGKYGYSVGDRILKEASHLFGSVVRKYDTIARYTGNKLLFLLTDTDERGAETLTGRLMKFLSISRFLGEAAPVTASIGIHSLSVYESAKISPEKMIRNVEIALEESKRRGGNRFSIYPSGPAIAGSDFTRNKNPRREG